MISDKKHDFNLPRKLSSVQESNMHLGISCTIYCMGYLWELREHFHLNSRYIVIKNEYESLCITLNSL